MLSSHDATALRSPALLNLPARRSKPEEKRLLQCPVSQMDISLGNPRDCTGVDGASRAAVRQHLTRAHDIFAKLCPSCNEDILDRRTFDNHHGLRGELCISNHKQRRGAAAEEQWDDVCRKLYPRATKLPSACKQLSFQGEIFDRLR
jgi:hypothetical protein